MLILSKYSQAKVWGCIFASIVVHARGTGREEESEMRVRRTNDVCNCMRAGSRDRSHLSLNAMEYLTR